MQLDEEQRDCVECGYAEVYVGDLGAERYIEQALDVFGKPSNATAGFYVYDSSGSVCGAGLYGSLEEARRFVDKLSPGDFD